MDFKRQNQEIEECILRIQSGDKKAFEQLYHCTESYIYFCIEKEGLPKDAVIDVMQEVYLAVYEGLDSLRDIHAALGWMKKIAFHKSMDYFRRQEKDKLLLEEEIDENANVDIPDMISLPEEIMEKQELQQIVQGLIGELEEEQQWLLKAYYFEECRVKEIAGQLGISENTVKTKLARARGKLKELVERLEKQQGIRLHSVQAAPVLLFLLELQAEAMTVPSEISAEITVWIKEELPKLVKMAAGETFSAGTSSATGKLGNAGIQLASTAAKKWIAGGIVLLLAGTVAVPNLLKHDQEQQPAVTTQAAKVGQTKDLSEQAEAASAEQTEEPPVVAEQESELMAYYHEVFDQIRKTGEWPKVSNDFTMCEGEINVSDVEKDLAYAVLDVNGDGEEELVVCMMHGKGGDTERQVAVYKYQKDTVNLKQIFGIMDSLYGEDAQLNFYRDKKAAILDGQDAERPGMGLYVYNSAEENYELKGNLIYWADTPENQDLMDSFPKDIDEDNDGVVWRLEELDVPEGVSPYSTFDSKGYDEWRQNNLNDGEKIEFAWTLFSEGWKTEMP